jgi:sialate O-acetylesterase
MKIRSLVIFLLVSIPAFSQVKLARIFSNHSVFQRQKPVPVWGWAGAGEKITITFNGQTLTTKTDATGKWQIKLAAMPAGGPYSLTVKGKTNTLTLEDIMVGEVWICSGQSNMEWVLKDANNASEEIRDAKFSQIRQFKVEKDLSFQHEKDLKTGEWVVCSPETAPNFTAVGYFFARELSQKLNVAVGLINTSWGGSQAESWISKESMLASDVLQGYAQQMPKNWEESDKKLDNELRENIFHRSNITLEDEKKYSEPDYDFSWWRPASIPGAWDWQGIWAFRGKGYMQKTINIPAELANKSSVLGFGVNDSPYKLYINGKLISEGQEKGDRKLTIPAGTWKTGNNSLLIAQSANIEPSWLGMGIFGNNDASYVDFGSEKISLAGDGWKKLPSFAEPRTYTHGCNNAGTILFNAMVAPLVPYAMQGVIWYQGETNAGRSYEYRKTFPLLIQDWRKQWNEVFPFLFVQLSSYGGNQNSNIGSGWAELREAQTMTLTLPKTGMAVTTDIGNPHDIHPRNKQDVGKRLANSALQVAYNQNALSGSPLYESVNFNNGKATISFKNVGSGLMTKDKYGYIRGFEIAGEDKVFYYAKAEITGNQVIVYSDKVSKPVAVRYAWTDSPDDANLFNADGFPVSPFRTDTWQGTTEKAKFQ